MFVYKLVTRKSPRNRVVMKSILIKWLSYTSHIHVNIKKKKQNKLSMEVIDNHEYLTLDLTCWFLLGKFPLASLRLHYQSLPSDAVLTLLRCSIVLLWKNLKHKMELLIESKIHTIYLNPIHWSNISRYEYVFVQTLSRSRHVISLCVRVPRARTPDMSPRS